MSDLELTPKLLDGPAPDEVWSVSQHIKLDALMEIITGWEISFDLSSELEAGERKITLSQEIEETHFELRITARKNSQGPLEFTLLRQADDVMQYVPAAVIKNIKVYNPLHIFFDQLKQRNPGFSLLQYPQEHKLMLIKLPDDQNIQPETSLIGEENPQFEGIELRIDTGDTPIIRGHVAFITPQEG